MGSTQVLGLKECDSVLVGRDFWIANAIYLPVRACVIVREGFDKGFDDLQFPKKPALGKYTLSIQHITNVEIFLHTEPEEGTDRAN